MPEQLGTLSSAHCLHNNKGTAKGNTLETVTAMIWHWLHIIFTYWDRANGRKKQKTNKTKFRMSMQNGADYWKPPPCNKGHIMMGTRVSVISSHQRPLSHQKKNQGLLWENDSSREEHSSNLIPFLNPGQYHSNTRGCCVDKGSILER